MRIIQNIKTFLCRLLGCGRGLILVVGPEGNITTLEGKNNMLIIDITKGKRRKLTATPTKKDGSPAVLDSALVGTVMDGGATFAAVPLADNPSAFDPNSLFVLGTGEVGDTTAEISADARPGPDVKNIVVPVIVRVHDADAENLGLNLGEEEDIPPSP